MKNEVVNDAPQFFPSGMACKITGPAKPYEGIACQCNCDRRNTATFHGPHIGPRLAKKLRTHHWHLLRIKFADHCEPIPHAMYEEVVAAKTVTPNAIQKRLAKAWDAVQIMWPNRQNGIAFATDSMGYFFATPAASA